jgi:hypothetical protein
VDHQLTNKGPDLEHKSAYSVLDRKFRKHILCGNSGTLGRIISQFYTMSSNSTTHLYIAFLFFPLSFFPIYVPEISFYNKSSAFKSLPQPLLSEVKCT